jgi:hypothetical protein
MGGAIGWLLKLLGIGPRRPTRPARRAPSAAARERAMREPGRPLTTPPTKSEAYWLARRRVIAYVAHARVPIRQAAAVRQAWLADLSKVYAQIATSPTGLVLDRAGAVGATHEPGFRAALALAQAIDPPAEAEHAHTALVGWLTCLHAACLALIDARKLRDRSLLGNFREQLGYARRLASVLVKERGALFTAYRLTVRPSIKAKWAATGGSEGSTEAEPPTRKEAPARRPKERGARKAVGRGRRAP